MNEGGVRDGGRVSSKSMVVIIRGMESNGMLWRRSQAPVE